MVHHRGTTDSLHHNSVRIDCNNLLGKPLAYRKSGIVIIRSDKDHNRVKIIAMVIAAALVAQLWEFLTAVWKEARFYNEV